ncbi:MAG: ATP-binding protein, partial [Eggerthellaceae bacterium]|nr:ATP-binding protein [Eggerthellaceae bacterium]
SANRAKSAFLANMSHEMRTPLNVVVGLSDLYMDAEGTPTDVLEDLKKINTAGSILLSIVNDVLDISKIEAGKFELEPMRYSTASLLNDIITLNMVRIGDKPIAFYVDIDETIPSELLGDELRLKQLFNNLLSNAFKYTQEGSVTLKVSAEKDGSDGLMLALSVSDTGIGIRPEDVEKLFTDYNQVDTRANRKIEGTGLGLSIAKRLVELMGGRISVESEYGKGSTFTAKVKQVSVSDKPLGKEVAENLRTFHYLDDKKHASSKLVRANMGYARVLVVDDLQTNLYVAEGMLKKYQMQIDCVTSGQAALERIACGKPVYDAIFLDHMMPGMDGIETAEKIRALGTSYAQSIPIISLTANAVAGAERMFLNSGFQAFLSKPIDILKLDAVLQVWVRDKAREAAIGESATVSQAEPRNLREAAGSKGAVGIPGIDGEKGLALYGHDFELYQAVLQSFAKSTPALLDGMRQVSQASLPGYAVNVHGLKGASANIAADGLRHQAERLEQAARAGNLAAVMAGNDALLHDALVLVAGIQAWLDEQGGTDAPKPRLDAPDPQLLGRLQFYSKNFDMDGVSETLDELENATYETNNDLVLWMREMADVSGFSEIAERLSEFGEVTK